jgi:general secretion pathway protein K
MHPLPSPKIAARRSSHYRARGVALIAVLLLVAGLIAIATAVVVMSVSQRRSAQRAFEAVERRERLDGALRVALAEISFGKVEGPFWYPHQPRIVIVDGKRVEITLERETGRIDLNTAGEKFLVAGLIAAGKSEQQAHIGAARIEDWIDLDDKPVSNLGAERDAYRQAHRSYEPRNAPMENIDEVRQVLGLADLSDAGLDVFTVYSQQLEPMASETPPAVRAALGWVDASHSVLSTQSPNSSDPVSYAGSVIRLRACDEHTNDRCRLVVVRVTGSARQPWQILRWQ